MPRVRGREHLHQTVVGLRIDRKTFREPNHLDCQLRGHPQIPSWSP
ncbi:hypothetical protein ALSL_0204 [Aerosticca soli]|uniref:Uncharacterized protein n=1 Tax=Aerosticca soli TaxID=2010829 RepID=A0A2Z6E1K6_9GAMM|nr:hypothetical protein ALSL_0204 [Aerosticca soli]